MFKGCYRKWGVQGRGGGEGDWSRKEQEWYIEKHTKAAEFLALSPGILGKGGNCDSVEHTLHIKLFNFVDSYLCYAVSNKKYIHTRFWVLRRIGLFCRVGRRIAVYSSQYIPLEVSHPGRGGGGGI